MWTRGRTGPALVLCATVMSSGCDGSDRGPVQLSPSPVLAGTYALTIRLPEHCGGRPGVVDTLQYDARLESTTFAYTSTQVQGGGYRKRTGLGELWHPAGARSFSLSWNIWDGAGCGGEQQYEDLDDGTSRAICGGGPARLTGNVIVADVDAELVINRVTGPSTACIGRFTFTFEPAP